MFQSTRRIGGSLCHAATVLAAVFCLPAAPALAQLTAPSPQWVTATGTATSRTLADRAADQISVLDFGADPSGKTPSDAAFVAADAAATKAGGKTIVLPYGTYLLNSHHYVTNNANSWIKGPGVTVTGSGWVSPFTDNYTSAQSTYRAVSGTGGQMTLTAGMSIQPSTGNITYQHTAVHGHVVNSDNNTSGSHGGVAYQAIAEIAGQSASGHTGVWGMDIRAITQAGLSGSAIGLEIGSENYGNVVSDYVSADRKAAMQVYAAGSADSLFGYMVASASPGVRKFYDGFVVQDNSVSRYAIRLINSTGSGPTNWFDVDPTGHVTSASLATGAVSATTLTTTGAGSSINGTLTTGGLATGTVSATTLTTTSAGSSINGTLTTGGLATGAISAGSTITANGGLVSNAALIGQYNYSGYTYATSGAHLGRNVSGGVNEGDVIGVNGLYLYAATASGGASSSPVKLDTSGNLTLTGGALSAPSVVAAAANSATLSGSASGPITLTAGGGTNVGVVIAPAGTGAFSLTAQPGSTAYGTHAVDLQTIRGTSTQVASGNFAFAVGANQQASAQGAVAIGNNSVSDGQNAIALGVGAAAHGTYGKMAFGSGSIAAGGDAQMGWHVLRANITTTSATRLTADGAAAGSANTVNLPDYTAFELSCKLVLRQPATGHVALFTLDNALVWRASGAASVLTSGSWTAGPNPSGETLAVTLAADTTNGGPAISVTPGVAGWHAVARCSTTEVQ